MRLNYNIYGQGKPLIFLHGFLEDSTMWENVWPAFKQKGYKIITIDLPCHGESRFEGDHCSMQQMAEAVVNILQIYNIQKPTIIGHSMGGYVGLELLRIMSCDLILLHSNFWEDSAEKKKDRNRVIEIVKRGTDLFIREAIPGLFAENNRYKCALDIDELIKKALQIPAHEIIAATAGLRDRRPSYDLMDSNDIKIIQGEFDPIIPSDVLNAELTKVSKSTEVVTLAGCGHMSIWEDEKTLIEEIDRLLI